MNLKKKPKENLKVSSGDERAKLTRTEAIILNRFTQKYETPSQIAVKEGKSLSCVYVHLSNIRRKGWLDHAGNTLRKRRALPKEPKDFVSVRGRLEAQQWVIRILWAGPRYKERLKRKENFIPDLDGNYLKLHKELIEIYSNRVFYGEPKEAFKSSLVYWEHFVRKLEHKLNVVLIKPGEADNWRLVKGGEYALEDSPIAKKAFVDGSKIRFFWPDDGKLFFTCDWSEVLEHEHHHPEYSKLHAERLKKQIVDFSRYDPRTNSELESLFSRIVDFQAKQAELNKETAAGLASVLAVQSPGRNVNSIVQPELDADEAVRRYTG